MNRLEVFVRQSDSVELMFLVMISEISGNSGGGKRRFRRRYMIILEEIEEEMFGEDPVQ